MTETKIENGATNKNGNAAEKDLSKSEIDEKPEVDTKPIKRDLDDSDDESPAGNC